MRLLEEVDDPQDRDRVLAAISQSVGPLDTPKALEVVAEIADADRRCRALWKLTGIVRERRSVAKLIRLAIKAARGIDDVGQADSAVAELVLGVADIDLEAATAAAAAIRSPGLREQVTAEVGARSDRVSIVVGALLVDPVRSGATLRTFAGLLSVCSADLAWSEGSWHFDVLA